LPKDVVAGDFYWIEKKGDIAMFAAADCTGHGVPGAMVSVVCNGALNRSVREYQLSDPAEILDRTKAIVVEEFEKSDEGVKDGMDIALCTLQENKLFYAGAHNPLWIIRKGDFSDLNERIENDRKYRLTSDGEYSLLEIRGDNQPIGKFDFEENFVSHLINLKKNDTIYLFSDGYVDQFGGDQGKKFKSANFKRTLLRIQESSMSEQQDFIAKVFHDWKGDLEQIDDVVVIGVKV